MLPNILATVKRQLPKFNDRLLIDLRKNEVNNLAQFIADRYTECISMVDPNLVLVNYEVLPPVLRLNYELSAGIKKNVIDIKDNESVLVDYNFKYYDESFKVSLYIPYTFEDSRLVHKGTNYECFLNVSEKLFSVRTGSSGVTIKVIRFPISFWRNTLHAYCDEVSGTQFVGNIVSCKMHYKKTVKTKKPKPTIIHYLLCKYKLPEVLVRFGLAADDAMYCEFEKFEEEYYYFRLKNVASAKDQIFLKVKKTAMDTNRLMNDIASTIVYFMSAFRFVTYQELIQDSIRTMRILLGKLIYSVGIDRIHALSRMDDHIEGSDTYLDNYTKEIFAQNGIIINDIYDLLSFVAMNISQIIVSYPNNNMYHKRVESINSVIIENLVSSIYYRIYAYESKPDFDHMFKSISKALRVSPRTIPTQLGQSDSVRFSPAISNDNWLLTVGDKVVKRLSAATKPNIRMQKKSNKSHGSNINAPANRFHPSMLVVESPIGFSSKPGVNCLVNPYAVIDESGGFVRDDFANETGLIAKYLANDQTL